MIGFRWLGVVLVALALCLGCQGERRPDTDPSVDELEMPVIEGGGSGEKKDDAK
jgi:hypothetical protein